MQGEEFIIPEGAADRVALWLAGIEPSHLKAPLRATVEAYQDELAPIARRMLVKMLGLANVSADPRLMALAEQYDVLMSAATFIGEHMDALATELEGADRQDVQLDQVIAFLQAPATGQATAATDRAAPAQRLIPAQRRKMQEAVDRVVRESGGRVTYTGVYGGLKAKFQVGSYNQIPGDRFEDVMLFLRELWKRTKSNPAPA
jgi:hypothetical protein